MPALHYLTLFYSQRERKRGRTSLSNLQIFSLVNPFGGNHLYGPGHHIDIPSSCTIWRTQVLLAICFRTSKLLAVFRRQLSQNSLGYFFGQNCLVAGCTLGTQNGVGRSYTVMEKEELEPHALGLIFPFGLPGTGITNYALKNFSQFFGDV